MFRACELKDQTYKKTRTLHFSDHGRPSPWVKDIRAKNYIFPRSERGVEHFFGLRRAPGYSPGRPRGVPPSNLMFRLLLCS